MRRFVVAGAVFLALVQVSATRATLLADPVDESPTLTATRHAPLPSRLVDYWLVPDATDAARTLADADTQRAVRGMGLLAAGRQTEGLTLLRAVAAGSALAGHAQLAAASALIELGRLDEAEATLLELAARKPLGAVGQATAIRLADLAVARATAGQVEPVLRALVEAPLSSPSDVWLRLGIVEEQAGHHEHAVEAYRRVHYQWPASAAAPEARQRLARLEPPAIDTPEAFATELRRAELLYAGRQWTAAREAFATLVPLSNDTYGSLVALRVAQCDYYMKRYAAARAAARAIIPTPRYGAEARYFDMLAARDGGQRITALALARELLVAEPRSEWAAEALNGLATEYIKGDDDEAADRVLRDLLERFPRHRHAERAAWKVGWWAYRKGQHADAAAYFDRAAATFPRADNRPAWLYWSGRARDQLGDRELATARYRLVVFDYGNSYYGRLASRMLEVRRAPPLTSAVTSVGPEPTSGDVPTEPVIRALLAGGRFSQALEEVQFAQKVWGDSPRLLATSAWIRYRQAIDLKATERFAALRGAINTMRRAYPQFMAAGGELLPPELLRVIFPLDYWPLITKYAAAHDLDPFLVAALVAQESTFTAEIRSSANAYGLMQVIPSTGRAMARKIGLRGFSVAMLRQPEPNMRIGTQYFKDLMARFGGAHFALAGYNAGPHRVAAWKQEAPDVPADEFIDNIPFVETQTYVKRILGTAEDYRRLYGGGGMNPDAGLTAGLPASGASDSRLSSLDVSVVARPQPSRRTPVGR